MAHPNEDLLRREVEGLSKGAVPKEFYTDDVVLHYPGSSRVAGRYQGEKGLDEFFRKLGEIVVSVERDLHDALANDEHGVQLLTVRAERKDGHKHEWRVAWICHFRDGRISELWGHIADQPALDEFLSG